MFFNLQRLSAATSLYNRQNTVAGSNNVFSPLRFSSIPLRSKFYASLPPTPADVGPLATPHGAVSSNQKEYLHIATIGTFIKDCAGFTGNIQTLTLKARIHFGPSYKKRQCARLPGLPSHR